MRFRPHHGEDADEGFNDRAESSKEYFRATCNSREFFCSQEEILPEETGCTIDGSIPGHAEPVTARWEASGTSVGTRWTQCPTGSGSWLQTSTSPLAGWRLR